MDIYAWLIVLALVLIFALAMWQSEQEDNREYEEMKTKLLGSKQ